MKVGEAINRIQALYSRGPASAAARLEDRYIYNIILTARALMVDNSFWMSGGWEYQDVCIDLIPSSPSECGCGSSFGVTFWKSQKEVPTPLKRNGNNILSVTSVDGTLSISETSWEAARFRDGNRYRMNEYFVRNGHLYYLSVRDRIKRLNMNGVFFDPVKAAMYNGDIKDANDVSLGVSPELWEHIFEMIKQEMGIFVQMEEDGTTDSADRPVK